MLSDEVRHRLDRLLETKVNDLFPAGINTRLEPTVAAARGVRELLENLHGCVEVILPAQVHASLDQALVGIEVSYQFYRDQQRQLFEQHPPDAIFNNMPGTFTNAWNSLAPVIAFGRQYSPDVRDRLEAAGQLKSQMQLLLTSAQKIHEDLDKLSVANAVRNQAQAFEGLATKFKWTSWVWLVATLAAATGTGILAWNFAKHDEKLASSSINWGVLIPHFLILSLAIWAVVTAGRIYRANIHNRVVNEHRATALKTFNVFVTTASDVKTKDAILAQAAATIFGPQGTGFGSDATEPLPAFAALDVISKMK